MLCNLQSEICKSEILSSILPSHGLPAICDRASGLPARWNAIPTPVKTFLEFREQLTQGKIRAAEKSDGQWKVNTWVKQGILLGFRLGELSKMGEADAFPSSIRTPSLPASFTVADRVRVVPGGSSVREGAYVAPSVICMPPMFINVGRLRGRRHDGGLARAGGFVRAGRASACI